MRFISTANGYVRNSEENEMIIAVIKERVTLPSKTGVFRAKLKAPKLKPL